MRVIASATPLVLLLLFGFESDSSGGRESWDFSSELREVVVYVCVCFQLTA